MKRPHRAALIALALSSTLTLSTTQAQTPAQLDRYNSWQDLATDAAASVNDPGWASVREHSAFHHGTLADRIVPK